jgi:hypothetical protein
MTLRLIASCAQTKVCQPEERHQLGQYSGRAGQQALESWVEALTHAADVTTQAADLYQGAHWRATKGAFDAIEAKRNDSELWVASAGWGLVRGDTRIVPYSASLGPGPDSIRNLDWPRELGMREIAQHWIRELTDRFIGSTLSWDAQDACVVVVSLDYYWGIEPFLLDVAGRTKNLLIFSTQLHQSPGSASPLLREFVMPIDERYRMLPEFSHLTNTSLNAGVAEWLVTEYPDVIFDTDLRNRIFADLRGRLPEYKRPPPNSMTDDEVLAYIQEHLAPGRDSATALLRYLRHELGQSCEQKRFGSLFRTFLNERNGGDLFDG